MRVEVHVVVLDVQDDEGPLRLHSQPHGPLQEDPPPSTEALSGHPDLHHHEPPAGGSTGEPKLKCLNNLQIRDQK